MLFPEGTKVTLVAGSCGFQYQLQDDGSVSVGVVPIEADTEGVIVETIPLKHLRNKDDTTVVAFTLDGVPQEALFPNASNRDRILAI